MLLCWFRGSVVVWVPRLCRCGFRGYVVASVPDGRPRPLGYRGVIMAEPAPDDKEYQKFLKELEKMKIEEKVDEQFEAEANGAAQVVEEEEAKPKVEFGSDEEKLLKEALVATVKRQLKEKEGEDPEFDMAALVTLRYRNFDIKSAAERLAVYMQWRKKEKVSSWTPSTPMFKTILDCGMSNVLPGTDRQGRIVIWIRKCFDDPKKTPVIDVVRSSHHLMMHEMRRRGAMTQFKGVTLLMDFSGSSYKNFDMKNSKEWQKVNKTWPMRYGKFLMVRPNSMVPLVFPVFKKMVPPKLAKRMFIVQNLKDLEKHVDPKELPPELGGTLKYDRDAWLKSLTETPADK
eukprot:g839.t1